MKAWSRRTSLAVLVLTMSMLTACSSQWREVDAGASEEEILSILDRMKTSAEVQALGASFVDEAMNDTTNTVYFRKSANPGSVPEAIFSMSDVSPFVSGGVGGNVFDMNLKEVSVAVVDGLSSSSSGAERSFILMTEFTFQDDSKQYFASSSGPGSYSFDNKNGVFEAEFIAKNGQTLILRTYDLSKDVDDELDSTVKFDVYRLNNDGSSTLLGHIGALAGFGS